MAPQRIAVFGDIEDDDDDRSSQSHDEEDDLDNDDVLEEDDDEEDNRSASLASVPVAVPSASAVTIAAVSNGGESHHTPMLDLPAISLSDSKRHRIIPSYEVVAIHPPPNLPERKPPPSDETRRLFQRLWTDEDEIELLQGFLEYTTQRGGCGPHLDTTMFYDQIKSKLQLDFNKNQLVEKLRRLKKKYRNVIGKINSGKDFSFKSPHDQTTFEISKKIWCNSVSGANLDDEDGDVKVVEDHSHRPVSFSTPTPSSKKRVRPASHPAQAYYSVPVFISPATKVEPQADNNNETTTVSLNNIRSNSSGSGNNGNTPQLIEESTKSYLLQLLKELSSGILGHGTSMFSVNGGSRGVLPGLAMNAIPLGFGLGTADLSLLSDERWRKQQILELEVYSKRLELVQEQIRQQLEELKSMGSSGR